GRARRLPRESVRRGRRRVRAAGVHAARGRIDRAPRDPGCRRAPRVPVSLPARGRTRVTKPTEWDAVVVGAGPAGPAAAAALAARGRRVLLLEKDRFPRRKVCGELLSGGARASLERLGVLEEVEAIAAPVRRGTLHLPAARPLEFTLPAAALGVSRFALDALLARWAAS